MITKIMSKLHYGAICLAVTVCLSACGSKKDILYFQGTEQLNSTAYQDVSRQEVRIVPGDNLLIIVTASGTNQQSVVPYNTVDLSRGGFSQNLEWQGYLVDEKGYINYPSIGPILTEGLTKAQLADFIQKELSNFLSEEPIVNIRFLNFQISILGEVNSPGVYQVSDERISIPEALSRAGDMTIYGQRHDVLICRVENGEKKFYHVDMTDPRIFYSDGYYLQQNDIVYVQPNKFKVMGANYNPMLSTYLSVAGLLVSISTFVISIVRN